MIVIETKIPFWNNFRIYVQNLKYVFRTSYSLLNQKIAHSSSSTHKKKQKENTYFHEEWHLVTCVIVDFTITRDRAWLGTFFFVVIVLVRDQIFSSWSWSWSWPKISITQTTNAHICQTWLECNRLLIEHQLEIDSQGTQLLTV
jgi:hypothetical protein